MKDRRAAGCNFYALFWNIFSGCPPLCQKSLVVSGHAVVTKNEVLVVVTPNTAVITILTRVFPESQPPQQEFLTGPHLRNQRLQSSDTLGSYGFVRIDAHKMCPASHAAFVQEKLADAAHVPADMGGHPARDHNSTVFLKYSCGSVGRAVVATNKLIHPWPQ
jgi:hypothetical protein